MMPKAPKYKFDERSEFEKAQDNRMRTIIPISEIEKNKDKLNVGSAEFIDNLQKAMGKLC